MTGACTCPTATGSHWFTGEHHRGPTWLTTHSPIEHFPLYQRAESLIPLGPVMAHVGERPTDELTLRVGDAMATSDWHGVARVDGADVTVTTTRTEPTVVVDGLPPTVEIRIVDGVGRRCRPTGPSRLRRRPVSPASGPQRSPDADSLHDLGRDVRPRTTVGTSQPGRR